MNHQEISIQVKREYEKICSTTIQRLFKEYEHDRKKLKINKHDRYLRDYSIRSHEKNNWIIFIEKSAGIEKYEPGGYLNYLAIVYYYSDQGLKVFHLQNGVLVSFNSHFFKRYNERMKLNLSNPLDIVKEYFRNGCYGRNEIIEKEGKCHIIGFRSQGLQFGLVKYNKSYIEWKTFVNSELAFRSQEKMQQQAVKKLQGMIKTTQLFQSVGGIEGMEENLLTLQNSYFSLTGKKLTA